MTNIVTLPAGRYLIGDLCYHDDEIWEEMIDHIDGKIHTLRSGRSYIIFRTAYGDGSYPDLNGNQYWVDSGTIGILQCNESLESCAGRTFDYGSDFQVYKDGALLHFGAVVIDTDPVYDEFVESYEESDNALEEEF